MNKEAPIEATDGTSTLHQAYKFNKLTNSATTRHNIKQDPLFMLQIRLPPSYYYDENFCALESHAPRSSALSEPAF